MNCRDYYLDTDKRTHIMGVLNVTPDSFSDGGCYLKPDSAVKRGIEMVNEGADIIDIGGESTRPGHQPVDTEEEIKRVIPVIEALSGKIKAPISIDTSKSAVAEKAMQAGASIVNDVWGLQRDKNIAGVVSRYKAGVVMMHNKTDTRYADIIEEILAFLNESINIAQNAGIEKSSMAIDPGIGFGKTAQQNLLVMKRLEELKVLNIPVLIGTSRKSMIGYVLDLPVEQRMEGTSATIALAISKGAKIVRVHDVREMSRVVRMTDAILSAS